MPELKGLTKLEKALRHLKDVADEVRDNMEEKQDWWDEKSEHWQESEAGQNWEDHLGEVEELLDEIDNLEMPVSYDCKLVD